MGLLLIIKQIMKGRVNLMIKMVDTAVPMNEEGYPVARAKHIWLDNDTNLQEAIDNGELGGGGTSITVDTEMSDISENTVQNKVIKKYVDDKILSGGNIKLAEREW